MNVVATVSSQALCQIGLLFTLNDVFQYDFCMGQELECFQG